MWTFEMDVPDLENRKEICRFVPSIGSRVKVGVSPLHLRYTHYSFGNKFYNIRL